jgi:dihydroorotate dehydrogenase electron transfer subunit
MYQQGWYSIGENTPLAREVYRMTLLGDTSAIAAPGQFVNIALEGRFLRRPISVCDWREGEITLIYKVLGEGTRQMSRMAPGEKLDVLTGLGNGFGTRRGGAAESKKPLLVGGGVGVPPLYRLAKDLAKEGRTPAVVMGFASAADAFYEEEFRTLGCRVLTATADGTLGIRGFVTDAIREGGVQYDYYFACGPLAMLRALYDACPTSGQLSFEERMGCGFGGCMGCSCQTISGPKRICKEGPVLEKEEILWPTQR